jgi:glycosyltransferase involved in cell wall biosynthesis
MSAGKTLYITNLGLLDNLARTQVLPYLEGLVKNGLGIEILSFEKKDNLKDAAAVSRMKERLRSSGIGWSYLRYHRRWGNIVDVLAGIARGYRIVKKNAVSMLHARASIPILIAWPIAKLLRRRVIYDRRGTMVGDFVDDVNIRNVFSVGILSRALDAFEKFIMRHSDAVIVLSDRALDLLKNDPDMSGRGVITEAIPCCVDLSRFSGAPPASPGNPALKDKYTMCYLGSLGTCYLLKEMASFFKALKKRKANAFFLIISHTDKVYIEDTMEKEALIYGIDYAVMGLEPDEVGQYLSQTKFGIMFIKPVECKIGSSPTKFAESLAAGIPVIVNKGIGDTEDIIRERRIGVVVEGFDTGSYEKAVAQILGLLDTEGLRDRCVETASKYFSLDLGIGRYLNVYKKIIVKP